MIRGLQGLYGQGPRWRVIFSDGSVGEFNGPNQNRVRLQAQRVCTQAGTQIVEVAPINGQNQEKRPVIAY